MQSENTAPTIPTQDIYDLTGQTFGETTVISFHHIYKGRRFWLVRHTCGEESIRPANEFRKKTPPCEKCEHAKLLATGPATPQWMLDLGFDDTFLIRFWSKVDRNGPIQAHMPSLGNCWAWDGASNSYGRGSISKKTENGRGHLILAPIASWMIANGKSVPEGLKVLHHCDFPNCVRPEHLWVGTMAENSADKYAKGRANNLFGEAHGNAKFTDDEVIKMRQTYAMGGVTYKDLAVIHKCSPSAIAWIIRRQYWKHLS